MKILPLIPFELDCGCGRIYFPLPQEIRDAILYLTVSDNYELLSDFRNACRQIGFHFSFASRDDNNYWDDGPDLSILDFESAMTDEDEI